MRAVRQITRDRSDGPSPLTLEAALSGLTSPPLTPPPGKNGNKSQTALPKIGSKTLIDPLKPAAKMEKTRLSTLPGRKALSISTGKRESPGLTSKGKSVEIEFRELTESEFGKEYKLLGDVMESTNTGMSVIFAKRLSDKRQCVIKVRDRKSSFKRQSDESEWKKSTLAQLSMPQMDAICQYYDCIATPRNYYVVMERVQGRDLFEQLCEDEMAPPQAQEVIYQIVEALKEMHACGRIHKDLKLENVMVDMQADKEPSSPTGRRKRIYRMSSAEPPSPLRKSTSRESFSQISTATNSPEHHSPKTPGVKLIDFDTVTDWEPSSPKVRDVLGSDGYIAPEAYGGMYSPASDIYQTGVIMYKLLTNKFPHNSAIFDDKPGENWVGCPAMKRIQERLKKERIDFKRAPFDKVPAAADLCQKMLAYEPSARPSAEEVLEHEWFNFDY